ncbi:MAG: hypothetical protein AUH38_00050 [Deltaproteobacteria bacterium 13_1_40CM_68_24]|nr:MAG: hypothetical protein AUH38_00050 [Deltaproteobacteria bacterium 13_1_40CM_68_24]
MTRSSAAAFALASLCACAGSYTNGSTAINPIDGGGQGISTGGGDAGADGGVDGGADAGPDAGCVALLLDGVGVVDSCVSVSPQSGSATGFVEDAGHRCAVSITLTTSPSPCSGVASGGSANAFSGYCGSMPCTSSSLPGTLTCNNSGAPCTIEICDAGTCP